MNGLKIIRRPKAKSLQYNLSEGSKNALTCCGVSRSPACCLGRPGDRPDRARGLDRLAGGARKPGKARAEAPAPYKQERTAGRRADHRSDGDLALLQLFCAWRRIQRVSGYSRPARPAPAGVGPPGGSGESEVCTQESRQLHPDLRGMERD